MRAFPDTVRGGRDRPAPTLLTAASHGNAGSNHRREEGPFSQLKKQGSLLKVTGQFTAEQLDTPGGSTPILGLSAIASISKLFLGAELFSFSLFIFFTFLAK